MIVLGKEEVWILQSIWESNAGLLASCESATGGRSTYLRLADRGGLCEDIPDADCVVLRAGHNARTIR